MTNDNDVSDKLSNETVTNNGRNEVTRRHAMLSGAAALPLFFSFGGSDSLGMFDNFWVANDGENINIDPDQLNFTDGLAVSDTDDGVDIWVDESASESDNEDDGGEASSGPISATTVEESIYGNPITPTVDLDLNFSIMLGEPGDVMYDAMYGINIHPTDPLGAASDSYKYELNTFGIDGGMDPQDESEFRITAYAGFTEGFDEDTELSITVLHDSEFENVEINPENDQPDTA
jgi:hypothetical protein